MNYYTIPPPQDLAAYVRFFWVLEGNATATEPYNHRSMADGCCELIFHYKGRFEAMRADGSLSIEAYSGVNGPSQKFSRYTITEDFGIFGAYLYPFALFQLFGVPASALINNAPDLQTITGRPGQDLEEQMITAPGNQARVNILASFIKNTLYTDHKKRPSIDSAILHVISSKGNVKINDLAAQYYLSPRQFERNFKDWAGFSPKFYSRIIRFQAATQEFNGQRKSLTEIAYQCGYYDQSHFIHDFKEFSGYHPRLYFSGNNEGTLWKEV